MMLEMGFLKRSSKWETTRTEGSSEGMTFSLFLSVAGESKEVGHDQGHGLEVGQGVID